jgi:hypothetical protein
LLLRPCGPDATGASNRRWTYANATGPKGWPSPGERRDCGGTARYDEGPTPARPFAVSPEVPALKRSFGRQRMDRSPSMSLRDEHQRTQLAPVVRQVLLQCAESCERALTDYTTQVGMVSGDELFRELLRAIATVRTAVDLLDEADSRRELALRLTAESCSAAAVRCRQARLDESLLRCAVACDRAADEAELVLTSLAH